MPDFDQLWPASFRGVPFHVKTESLKGGRRIVTHEFPNRDEPFHEDLGASKKEYPITAYVASETSLLDATALTAVLDMPGPGILVLPAQGPVLVRITAYERSMELDTLGMQAFTVHFVRQGFNAPLASIGALASQIFAAGNVVVAAASTLFGALSLVGLRGDVVLAAQADADTLVASVESIREGETVDTVVSTGVRDDLATLYANVPTYVSRATGADGTFVSTLATAARDLVPGMDPASATAAFADLADSVVVAPVPVNLTPTRAVLAANAIILARTQRLVALVAYADALASRTFVSRPEGITARAEASERFAAALADCTGGDDADLADAIQALRGRVAEYLSQLITDLRPIVTVSTAVSLPALWWAQRLYGDALRAEELVTRNAVRHAGLMPLQFEALAS